ncbi:MAG TPA: ergothioneine biosynthesis protein EgtB [Acidimicrobiales bacterium]|nr:ergothioneine biosynthesis protein EgtB [Acidimicrobiales bacterium]
MDLKAVVAAELERGRRRSLDLLAPLPDAELVRQHSSIMSPLVWDLAHVGNYEELWLLRAVAGAPPIDATLDDLYDAFRHPRPSRPALPLLRPPEARRYIADVRARVLDVLERVDLDDGDRPLLAGAFVYGMVVQHEHQHDETMLATLQLMEGDGYRPLAPPPPRGTPPSQPEVRVPAGPFVMGTDDDPWAYDNERPAHVVDLAAFWIDTAPVTNGAYLGFVEDGGYDDRRWWTDEGWSWRQQAPDEHAHPHFWRRTGPGAWARRRFGVDEDLPLDEPVQHVCWHEAAAYASWAGKRLPTEAEWEKSASWAPTGAGRKRRYPWGDHADPERANLAQRHFGPAPVGAYPGGASPSGVHQLVGDVWEWTSSEFDPYPGFRSFPYREYSEAFFGSGYKVLRGGSWATAPCAARTTFRNWDFPIRRQIFAGFRCARDDA